MKASLIALALVLGVGSVVAQLPVCPKYVVQQGDSLYSITQKFNILTPDELTASLLACGQNGDLLQIGQEICLPGADKPGCANVKNSRNNAQCKVYVVQQGDTIESVALSLDLFRDTLEQLNKDIQDGGSLKPNTYLKLPPWTTACGGVPPTQPVPRTTPSTEPDYIPGTSADEVNDLLEGYGDGTLDIVTPAPSGSPDKNKDKDNSPLLGPNGEILPDPATGCESKYHTQTTSIEECNSYCQAKLVKNNNQGTISPKLYAFNGYTCCNCMFKRTPKDELPTDPTTDPVVDPTIDPVVDPVTDVDSPKPTTDAAGNFVLDPTTFKPPTATEVSNAANPAYTPTISSGESMVYAVMHVIGMPWTLPLPYEQIVDFIYAFNNVTGEPWQYKGAVFSQPNVTPVAPTGVPPVKMIQAPAPEGQPPAPVAEAPAAPVVDPAVPVVDPAAPVVDPVAPVDPNAVPVPPATDPNAVPVPTIDPVTNLPVVTPAPTVRRLLRSSLTILPRRSNQGRKLLQDYYAPPDDGVDTGTDYGASDYGADTGAAYGFDAERPQDGTGLDYQDPPVDPERPGDGTGLDYQDTYEETYESPSPDPAVVDPAVVIPTVDPVAGPSLMPLMLNPPPLIMSPPPAPLPVPVPADADGIWYFAALPLKTAEQLAMSQALVKATSRNGQQVFLKSLTTSGITAAQDVELRYVGDAHDGFLDITKRLEGDILGSGSTAAEVTATPSGSSSSLSTGAIVGIAVGCAALLAAIAAGGYFWYRRSQNREPKVAQGLESTLEPDMTMGGSSTLFPTSEFSSHIILIDEASEEPTVVALHEDPTPTMESGPGPTSSNISSPVGETVEPLVNAAPENAQEPQAILNAADAEVVNQPPRTVFYEAALKVHNTRKVDLRTVSFSRDGEYAYYPNIQDWLEEMMNHRGRKWTGCICYNNQAGLTDHGTKGHAKGIVLWNEVEVGWLVHSLPSWPEPENKPFSIPEGEAYISIDFTQFAVGYSHEKRGQSFIWVTGLPRPQLDAVFAQLAHMNVHIPVGHCVPAEGHINQPWNSKKYAAAANLLPSGSVVQMSDRVQHLSKKHNYTVDIYSNMLPAHTNVSPWVVQTCRAGSGKKMMPDTYIIDTTSKNEWSVYNWPADEKIPAPTSTDLNHSKWAVSHPHQSNSNSLCFIGDLNRMDSQKQRGGGGFLVNDQQLHQFLWKNVAKIYNNEI